MSTEENDAPATGGVSASPSWMATQAPKAVPLMPSTSQDVTPLPKSRRPRRTKAQMLADAAARPDAQIAGTVNGEIVSLVDDHTVRAAENYPPPLTWYERNHVLTRHAPLAVGVLALIVACFALAR